MSRPPTIRLGDVLTRVRNGANFKQQASGRYPVTRIETISDGTINAERVRWADVDDTAVSEHLLQSGDILFSHINSPDHIGKTAIYTGAPSPLLHGINLLLLRPDTTRVRPRWLLWQLKSERARAFFRRRCKRAVNQASLNTRDVQDFSFELPPLSEQERIVKLLDEADALKKLRADADTQTSAVVPALFHEMFGDSEHTDLPVRPLAELVTPERPITYGILKPGPDVAGGIPYVRVVDIKHNRLHVHQLHRTTPAIAEEYRRSTLRPGDILITIRGTVGRTCIVPDELEGANITQDTARLAVVPSIDKLYVAEFLNTPWAQGWMSHHMLGQAVKGINLGDLRKLPTPVPPLDLQKQFAERVSEIRTLEASQTESRKWLDNLFQSMLYRAFSGEL